MTYIDEAVSRMNEIAETAYADGASGSQVIDEALAGETEVSNAELIEFLSENPDTINLVREELLEAMKSKLYIALTKDSEFKRIRDKYRETPSEYR